MGDSRNADIATPEEAGKSTDVHRLNKTLSIHISVSPETLFIMKCGWDECHPRLPCNANAGKWQQNIITTTDILMNIALMSFQSVRNAILICIKNL